MKHLHSYAFLWGVAVIGCENKTLALRWENPECHVLEKTYQVRIKKIHKLAGIRSSPSMAGPLDPVRLEGEVIAGEASGLRLIVIAPALVLPKGLKEEASSEWLIAHENICIGMQNPNKSRMPA